MSPGAKPPRVSRRSTDLLIRRGVSPGAGHWGREGGALGTGGREAARADCPARAVPH